MIQFNKVHLSYNGIKIIANLSLKITKGQKVVISGKSGSGKSSLFSLLLGFAEPDEGKVLFGGTCIDEESVWGIRKKIAYVSQDANIGSGVIKDILNTFTRLKANNHLNHTKEDVNNLLKHFGLPSGIIHKNMEELSGGEKQRLAIIIAILLKRDVFLLDEITSALDKELKEKVANYFIERTDVTCLVISHDPIWMKSSSVQVFNLEEGMWKH